MLTVKEKFQRTMKRIYREVKRQEQEAKQSNPNVGSAFKVKMPGGEELTFDMDNFRPNKVSISGITHRARQILINDPSMRTEAELRSLMVTQFVKSRTSHVTFSLQVNFYDHKLILQTFFFSGSRK